MNIKEVRSNFPSLKVDEPYLDSSSSSLTPTCVIEAINDYYNNFSCNLHRGEYFSSIELDKKVDNVRSICKQLINAYSKDEIIFTSGSTLSSNMIVEMIFNSLTKKDKVMITPHAHSSLFAPIYNKAKGINLEVISLKLKPNGNIDYDYFEESLNSKVKAIFLSHVTNLYGKKMNIKKVKQILLKKKIDPIIVVDAAQSIAHTAVDVKKMGCDFLFFSGHKIFGPTGVGILWAKTKWLKLFQPPVLGGGQITNIINEKKIDFIYKDIPYKFESGTLPLASILGLGEAIKFQLEYGTREITKHIKDLKEYATTEISKLKWIKVHSQKTDLNLVFSVKGHEVHDVATHLAKNGISIRGGQHCAQLLSFAKINHPRNTLRVSFQIYNNYNDVDKLVKELKKGKNTSYLDGFIN